LRICNGSEKSGISFQTQSAPFAQRGEVAGAIATAQPSQRGDNYDKGHKYPANDVNLSFGLVQVYH
jgi:hypothetical protein